MNCRDVRENLSAYVDDMLDRQIREMMDTHLATCKACRQELSSMRSLVEQLGAMGGMKAPEDFLATFHERLETGSFWSRLKDFLFVPMQIKIPLEFATLSIVGVLIFSLYSTYYPRGDQASQPRDIAVQGVSEPAVVRESAPKPPEPPTKGAEDGTSRYVQAAKQQPVELALVLPQTRGAGEYGPGAPGAGQPLAAEQGRHKDAARVGYKVRAQGKALPEAEADEAGEVAPAQPEEPTANKQLVEATQESPGLIGIILKIHELIGLSGGRILSEEIDRENGKDRVILAEIPAGQYGDFVGKVSALAQAKHPVPTASATAGSPVLVRIRLVAGE